MFVAGIGIFAALAFVLGLGALALWALKRFSNLGLSPRSRVPLEVVQRVSLGPKTGLAVVRVGEKVMALSVGEGGVRPLFELDESDRQRVIATSTVPVPMVSSPEAAASFAQPGAGKFGALLMQNLRAGIQGGAPVHVPVNESPTSMSTLNVPPSAATSATVSAAVSAAAKAAASAPATSPAISRAATVDRHMAAAFERAVMTPANSRAQSNVVTQPTARNNDLLGVLRMSLQPGTRVASLLLAAIVVTGATPLHAQGEPPVTPPPVQQIADSIQRTIEQAAAQGTSGAQPQAPAAPQAPVAPRNGGTRTATPATTAASVGNGASVSPRTPNGARPVTDMRVNGADAATNQRATSAPTAPVASADDALTRALPQMDIKLGDGKEGGLRLSGTVGIVVMMGLLTLLPTLLLMMTGFTRILIVLHFLKQAMGTQGTPPAQLLAGLALLLTGFVMAPTFTQMNRDAITPWLDGKMTQVEMMKEGVKPMREFMLRQTRPSDLKTFIEMSRMEQPNTPDDVPLHVLMSAFVASELRTAFQIGFAIYLPFIVIDAVVASVLMSMGMFMLPPAMISLPFKLLLFVLVDGWSLTITSLVQSFR